MLRAIIAWYALIKGLAASLIRDPEVLDVSALQLHIELTRALVHSHV